MLHSFIYAFLLILFLTGLFFLFYVIINKGLCFGARKEFYTVIAGYEENENLCDEIFCALTQMHLFSFSSPVPLIVVDYNLSEETKKRCLSLAEPYSCLVFCKEEELCKIIAGNLYLKD